MGNWSVHIVVAEASTYYKVRALNLERYVGRMSLATRGARICVSVVDFLIIILDSQLPLVEDSMLTSTAGIDVTCAQRHEKVSPSASRDVIESQKGLYGRGRSCQSV